MPRVSSKRQITLPAAQCRIVGINPGDKYKSFTANGHISIVRQTKGSAWKCLNHLNPDNSISEQQSLHDSIERRRETAQ